MAKGKKRRNRYGIKRCLVFLKSKKTHRMANLFVFLVGILLEIRSVWKMEVFDSCLNGAGGVVPCVSCFVLQMGLTLSNLGWCGFPWRGSPGVANFACLFVSRLSYLALPTAVLGFIFSLS